MRPTSEVIVRGGDLRGLRAMCNVERCPAKFYMQYTGRRLVIAATAACVWDDLAALGMDHADHTSWGFDVMAVNNLVEHLHWPVAHCYSNDHHGLLKWVAAMRQDVKAYFPRGPLHTCTVGVDPINVWPWHGHGTSALGAVLTGIAMGYKEIILCGAPLDDTPHYFDEPWHRTNFSQEIRDGRANSGGLRYWENYIDRVFEGKVRSMSGRTRELLGGPDD